MKSSLLILIATAALAWAAPDSGNSPISNKHFDPSLQQSMIWTEAAPGTKGDPIFVAFRKTFDLSAQPKAAELRIFADLRYLLWVNGRYVVRGPVRFDPQAPQFDVVDLGSHLQAGPNTLAVLVLGRANNNAMMRHAPGLAAELRLTDASCKIGVVKTDESWRWNDKTAYGTPVLKYNQGTWSDKVDARLLGDEWTTPSFDDSKWRTAQKTEGTAWGPLKPRATAPLTQTSVPAAPTTAEKYPVQLAAGKTVVFDAGKMVQGFLFIDLETTEGCELTFEPGQRFDGTKIGDTHEFKTTYTTRAGRQSYLSTGSYGCRYVAITAVKGNITVHGVTFVDRRYPYADAGRFSSSDPFLDELWKRAVHTVRICSEDGYLDSALREQNVWMGDAAIAGYPVARVTLAGPGEPLRSDDGLIKNVLRYIAQSQLSDGRLLAHHPSQSVDIHAYIEDYSCLWVESLRQVYEHTGDKDLVRELWPVLLKQMDWFLVRRTHRGLVFAREFVMFDNPLKYKYCEGATLNAFVYKALVDSAVLGDALGESKQATLYREAAAQLARSFNDSLWNEKQSTYNSAILDFKPAEPSVHAAMLALNRGLVPDDRRAKVTKWMLANTDKIGMPYTHHWLFEEQYRCDTPEQDLAALNGMRKKWEAVLKRTDTGTLTEAYSSGESCHNFGAVPAYFLSTYVLGVSMEEPVWKNHLLVEPRPGDLTHAEGVVVTPLGLVPVEWKRESAAFSLSVTVPPGATATVRLPVSGSGARLNIDGKPVPAKSVGRYLEAEIPAGKHTAVLSF